MTSPELLCIDQTKKWIQTIVIALNLCPFAKREMERDSVLFQVCDADTDERVLSAVILAFELLDTNPAIETMFLIFPTGLVTFLDYLDYADQATACLSDLGYDGIYQLATFHPHYCFEGTPVDCVTNYTNRSPYPMFHLLREKSITQAIDFYGDTDIIPEKNIACLRALGLKEVQARLLLCMKK